MANKTNFLNLTLPANNEFNDVWDQPINENFVKIDEEIESISNEILSARFSLTSLSEFLSIAHNNDGTLKPSEEQEDGRNSPIYGSDDGLGNDYALKDRLDLGEFEVFDARMGEQSLVENVARMLQGFHHPDTVLSGPSNVQSQPNFMTSAGAEFKLEADPEEILFNIDGNLMKLKVDTSITASGADGTKYLVAQKPSEYIATLDRSTQQAGATTTYNVNNDKVQIFSDTGVDYTTEEVRAGMILRILNTSNAGDYVIAEVAPGAEVTQLLIIGTFKQIVGSINYKIVDPLKPEFSVEDTYVPAKGKCIIGEGEFAAGALTSTITYAFKREYESQFNAVDVSVVPTFELILNHNLGEVPKQINIFASQANDGSLAVEPLSHSAVSHDLEVDVTNTLIFTPGSFTPGVFDPGSSDATYQQAIYVPGALNGDVTASLIGNIYDLRSVMIKADKHKIYIKNIKDNHFYRDYDGTDKMEGFLKVVCKK